MQDQKSETQETETPIPDVEPSDPVERLLLQVKKHLTTNTNAMSTLASEVSTLRSDLGGRVQVIERYVFGSQPPPRPGSMPDPEWLEQQAKANPESPAVVPTLARIERKTDEGNSVLGVGVRGLARFYGTREGRLIIGALAVALAGLLGGGAMHTSSPPPAPTVQVVRVEVPAAASSTAPPETR